MRLLEEEDPGAPWMIAGLGVDIGQRIAGAVRRGGNIWIGLEDAPFDHHMTSIAWVGYAVAELSRNSAEPAGVHERRSALAGRRPT